MPRNERARDAVELAGKWEIALATQNSTIVEELIDREATLDAIRNTQHEKKSHYSYGSRSSPKLQSKHTYKHTQELHKYNPTADDVRDITCWRCGVKGHASFTCNLPPPQRGSHIAPLRNTSRHSQDSNNQRNTPYSQSRNITKDCISSPRGCTGSNSADSRGSSSRV
ncbi:hypothetical protein AVEN_58118-1 [Araneus ventricosus]|uniref:CCHC-type domain-containing protein n=1 Tax=Araneus ventricosus TaxID=182803 RepID=A0A4Y2KYB7_ARAVE|nr:hypothetical protein AVEN_58118-1 [Araneus ventricosus]